MTQPPKLLAEAAHWLTWAYDPGKATKVPTSLAGKTVSAYDPDEWLPWTRVANHPRPAFFFQRQAGLFGVDLDGCLQDGQLLPWAVEVVAKFATYAEISPSGTGLKLYCAGHCDIKKAKKLGGEVGGKKSGVELHGYGYFCFTGNVFGERREVSDCQESLAWLMAKYWPPKTALTNWKPALNASDAERRAAAYMKTVPPAISGQNGHGATMYAAGVLACGFGLSDDQAIPLLSAWNATCVPPWEDASLVRKLAEARKTNAKPIGYLLDQMREPDSVPDVDLSDFEADPLPKPAEKLDPGPLSQKVLDRLPGLVGEIVRFNLATARHPQPELALAGALCLMSVLTGRKIKDRFGTRTNIYTVSLAPTGAGKEHARKINKAILFAANADTLLGEESWASASGLLRSLSDYPARLYQIDEIGRLMMSLKNSKGTGQEYAIGGELLKLYSSSDTVYTGGAHVNAADDLKIKEPHCVVHGTHTEMLWEGVTKSNVHEGLLGRLMVFEAAGRVPERFDIEEIQVPAHIGEWAKRWADWLPGGGELDPVAQAIQHTPEAKERSQRHRKQIGERLVNEDKDDRERSAIWVRSGEKASKLALLLAASRVDDPDCEEFEIGVEDVELGIAISNWSTRKTVAAISAVVGESQNESNRKLLLAAIDRGEESPVTTTEIYRSRAGKIETRERQALLADLVEAGMIGSVRVAGKGRPTTAYYRVA